MNFPMRLIAAILLTLALALSSAPAEAAMTLNQAVHVVKQRTHGRILSAHTVRRGNHKVHRVKVLTRKGHVRVIRIDGGPVRKRKNDRRRRR